MRLSILLYVGACILLTQLVACGGGDEGSNETFLSVQNITYTTNSITTETPFTNNQSQTSSSAEFHIQFSHALDQTHLNSSNVVIHDMNGHKPVRAKVSYDAASRILTISPASLKFENHYMIQLLETVVSVEGHRFSSNPEYTFFTEFRPSFFSQEPTPNEIDVSTRASVRVAFENPMNRDTINSSTFYLRDAQGQTVEAEPIRFVDNVAILKPLTQLTQSTRYTIILSNSILDRSGQPFSVNDTSWFFQTRNFSSSTVQFGTPGNEETHDVALVRDQAGQTSFYAVGSTTSQIEQTQNFGQDDAIIIKFDVNHNQVWAKQIGTPSFDSL